MVSNSGSATLTVNSLVLDSPLVTVDPASSFSLETGQQKTLSLTFSLTDESNLSAKLVVTSVGGSRSVSLKGSGYIPPAQVDLSASQLQFEPAFSGQSAQLEVTVKNSGGKKLVVSSIESDHDYL